MLLTGTTTAVQQYARTKYRHEVHACLAMMHWGATETTAGEYYRSFFNWFVPVPPQDYQARKLRLPEYCCCGSKGKYALRTAAVVV